MTQYHNEHSTDEGLSPETSEHFLDFGTFSNILNFYFSKKTIACPATSQKFCLYFIVVLYVLFPVHGSWSIWSAWTPCSKTCDIGFEKRVRDCTNPAPVNGGKPCKGVPIETKQCCVQLCPGLEIYWRIKK